MRVLLTGGTGFIGQPLARAMLTRGWEVSALVRRPESRRARALEKMGAQLIPGDVTRRETLAAAMAGQPVVVHNAGQYEFGVDLAGRERMYATNVSGTEQVLGLAQELSIARTVYVSAVLAYGDSGPQPQAESYSRQAAYRTYYEHTKSVAHAVAVQYQQRGLPLVIVCPNAAVGANDHSSYGYFLRMYLNRLSPPIAWSPGTIQGCVHVADLAEGIVRAVESGRPGETYFLSGECRPLREQLGYWSQRPGALRPQIWLPARLAAALFAPLEPLQRRLGLPAVISRETVYAAATNLYYPADKARAELGWQPRDSQAMWLETMDEELELLARRRGQSLIERIQPWEEPEF